MHKLPNFSQNSWFKFFGIMAVIYFALFSNKENPNSLVHDLKKENIKQGIDEVSEKTKKIYKNIKLAQEFHQRRIDEDEADYGNILVIDEFESQIGGLVACNDMANIDLEIKNMKNEILQPKTSMQLIIGKNNAPIIEKYLLKMRESSIRVLNIPSSHFGDSKILENFRQQGFGQIIFRIELKKVIKNNENQYQCR